ncbi:MAG: hypothetical protein COB85_02290 [Bacteroidetes bacterium]|nr:MAG: hypothetical protein COB85_02290 [Bacteroidota bacterium]
MTDVQIKEIQNLLVAYGAGEYHKQGKISAQRDEIDMIISGINLLGEELLATTVSRDYFSGIYNSVADMVFVVSPRGMIQDVNNAVGSVLDFEKTTLIEQSINTITEQGGRSFFNEVKKNLAAGKQSFTKEIRFTASDKRLIPVSCSCSKIIDQNSKLKGYLIVAEDISERKETEKRILRTIVDTQEKEQKRVAADLHDSLGQELSTVKLLLSAINEGMLSSDDKYKEAYETCKSILDSSIINLRSICFDLMPASLENGGIHMALEELVDRLSKQSLIKFSYKCSGSLPILEKSLEIVIYRIAQEFINNSIKHAHAGKVKIALTCSTTHISFSIKDNGIGFDIANARASAGRGLSTMSSRAKAFNGSMKLNSKPGKGTQLLVTFPYNV